MRRRLPGVLVVVGFLLLAGSYLLYTRRILDELRRESRHHGLMYGRIYRALANPRDDVSTGALFELSRHILEAGVPVVVTDADGRPTAVENLPATSPDDPRVPEYIARLDRQNPPVVIEGVGTIHYGDTPLVQETRWVPAAQAGVLVFLILAGAWALRASGRAERERVWAGMAREAAHQLATPISSLSGWVELLQDRASDATGALAVKHMSADLERLERVAHRFERIGRPPRRDDVDAAALVDRVAGYFRARVPTLAHTVAVRGEHADATLPVKGDAVLLEWALESLARNAIDALAGRGGTVVLSAERLDDGRTRLRVADDGPGVPRELRTRIFEAGFSTKERGWGIGLSLTRRIVEESHRGRLVLTPADRGATFDIILG